MQKTSTPVDPTETIAFRRSRQQRRPYTFTQSQHLCERAHQFIPGGSQHTRSQLYPDWPSYFARAKGCRMWDLDGNEFIDLLCSIGPIILGYAYDRVDNAVIDVIRSSFQSSTNHPVQV